MKFNYSFKIQYIFVLVLAAALNCIGVLTVRSATGMDAAVMYQDKNVLNFETVIKLHFLLTVCYVDDADLSCVLIDDGRKICSSVVEIIHPSCQTS